MQHATLNEFRKELAKIAAAAASADDVAKVLRKAMLKHVQFDRMAGMGQLDDAGQAAMRANQKRIRVLQQLKRNERDAAPSWVMDVDAAPKGMNTSEMNMYAKDYHMTPKPNYGGDAGRPAAGSGREGYLGARANPFGSRSGPSWETDSPFARDHAAQMGIVIGAGAAATPAVYAMSNYHAAESQKHHAKEKKKRESLRARLRRATQA